jgi:hypothetical protein
MPRFHPPAASLVADLSSLRVNISHNWAEGAQDARQKRWFAQKGAPWCFRATPLKNRGKRAANPGIDDRPLRSFEVVVIPQILIGIADERFIYRYLSFFLGLLAGFSMNCFRHSRRS